MNKLRQRLRDQAYKLVQRNCQTVHTFDLEAARIGRYPIWDYGIAEQAVSRMTRNGIPMQADGVTPTGRIKRHNPEMQEFPKPKLYPHQIKAMEALEKQTTVVLPLGIAKSGGGSHRGLSTNIDSLISDMANPDRAYSDTIPLTEEQMKLSLTGSPMHTGISIGHMNIGAAENPYMRTTLNDPVVSKALELYVGMDMSAVDNALKAGGSVSYYDTESTLDVDKFINSVTSGRSDSSKPSVSAKPRSVLKSDDGGNGRMY